MTNYKKFFLYYASFNKKILFIKIMHYRIPIFDFLSQKFLALTNKHLFWFFRICK